MTSTCGPTPRQVQQRGSFTDTESSNWAWDPVAGAYYWHRFFSHQPDLNYDNPLVHEAVFEALDFWLDKGVDGVRLDAIPYLYEREGTMCENLPETHAFLKKLRAHVDSKYEDRMLLAEANQWPEDAVAYFGNGDECHMAFHFPLMPRLFMAVRWRTGSRSSTSSIRHRDPRQRRGRSSSAAGGDPGDGHRRAGLHVRDTPGPRSQRRHPPPPAPCCATTAVRSSC